MMKGAPSAERVKMEARFPNRLTAMAIGGGPTGQDDSKRRTLWTPAEGRQSTGSSDVEGRWRSGHCDSWQEEAPSQTGYEGPTPRQSTVAGTYYSLRALASDMISQMHDAQQLQNAQYARELEESRVSISSKDVGI
eukprot:gene18894-25452_t